MNKYIALVLLVALVTCSGIAFAQKNKPLYNAPLGVQAFTFRKSFPIDVAKTLDTIKMMGFTEMESGSHGMPPEAFKKLCDERGISIPSSEGGYDQLIKSPDSIAHDAKVLGAKYVMCAWIPHHDGAFTLEDAKNASENLIKNGEKKTMRSHFLHIVTSMSTD